MKMSEERPRQRQNLDRLLKFCVENTLAEDPGDRSSSSIEPEAWLQEALKNFTGEDEVSLIKKCLMLLSTPFGELSADPEEDFMTRENALEQIESVVDNIDNAKDCFKLGGLDVFLKYIDDNMHCTLQWQALSVLGSCLQNNAYCQEQALKINILSRLLKIVDGDFGDTTVNVKAVYALGCMIRGCEEAERQFIEKDGFSYLLRAVERNVPKLNIKAIFLISNLTDENQKNIETLCNMGMVEKMIAIIQGQHEQHHEHVLHILLKFVKNHHPALSESRRQQYDLKRTLENRKHYLQQTDPEAYEEEISYCSELLKLCFSGDNVNDETER